MTIWHKSVDILKNVWGFIGEFIKKETLSVGDILDQFYPFSATSEKKNSNAVWSGKNRKSVIV